MRSVHADVIAELAKDSFYMSHLVALEFSTPVYMTDYANDISHGGKTYLASGHLLDVASPQESQELKVGTISLTLSGVEQSFISVFLGQEWINRKATFSRAVLTASGDIIGEPVVVFSGQISQFKISESQRGSDINVSISSHWADFQKKAGRLTNTNSQQQHFPNDLGFEYAANTVKDIKWGRE